MRLLTILFSLSLLMAACDSAPTQKQSNSDEKIHPYANLETHRFFNWWIAQQKNAPIALNDQLRNKILNRTDASELQKYFKKKGLNLKLFEGVEDSIKLMQYRRFDKSLISADVLWVDQNRLRGCRKIGKDAMWDCLEQDYGKKDYYYVSPPVFSSDGNWVLVSVNYMNKNSEKSGGGGRLYKRLTDKTWEEVAFLSYWGSIE